MGPTLPLFRDITLDKRKRKSSNEDLNTPKKRKHEDTPRRGGGIQKGNAWPRLDQNPEGKKGPGRSGNGKKNVMTSNVKESK